tara:strand:- start:369 stop:779 length:411 start_codon:yes stop_codon:yes gene_type:complete
MANKYETFGEMKPYGGKYAKLKQEMKADQTENVKKLMTSDDAYSPEKMYMARKSKRGGQTTEVPEGTKGARYFKQLTPIEQSRLVDKKRRAQKIKGTKKFKPPPPKRKIPTKPPVKTTGKVKLALRGGGRAYGKNS